MRLIQAPPLLLMAPGCLLGWDPYPLADNRSETDAAAETDGDADTDADADTDTDTDTDTDSDADTGSPAEWTYEGEGAELNHACGHIDQNAWLTCDNLCAPAENSIVYGPYVALPKGSYKIEWQIKTDSADRTDLTVLRLDVARDGSTVLGERLVSRAEFLSPGAYYAFDTSFLHDGEGDLEFRVQYADSFRPCYWVDRITVTTQ